MGVPNGTPSSSKARSRGFALLPQQGNSTDSWACLGSSDPSWIQLSPCLFWSAQTPRGAAAALRHFLTSVITWAAVSGVGQFVPSVELGHRLDLMISKVFSNIVHSVILPLQGCAEQLCYFFESPLQIFNLAKGCSDGELTDPSAPSQWVYQQFQFKHF